MLSQAMELSGSTLPQVSADGNGSISGTFHIVTTDGAGPVQAVLDSTGTGAFSQGVMLNTVTQVPGTKGNIAAPGRGRRWLSKRAANVNEDYPVAFSVPAGTTCSGTVAGQQNVCLVKIANSNKVSLLAAPEFLHDRLANSWVRKGWSIRWCGRYSDGGRRYHFSY
jgi:hypothetical protein